MIKCPPNSIHFLGVLWPIPGSRFAGSRRRNTRGWKKRERSRTSTESSLDFFSRPPQFRLSWPTCVCVFTCNALISLFFRVGFAEALGSLPKFMLESRLKAVRYLALVCFANNEFFRSRTYGIPRALFWSANIATVSLVCFTNMAALDVMRNFSVMYLVISLFKQYGQHQWPQSVVAAIHALVGFYSRCLKA